MQVVYRSIHPNVVDNMLKHSRSITTSYPPLLFIQYPTQQGIHHNQLSLTKFRRILRYVKNDVNRAANCQIMEPVNREDGRGKVVLVVSKKNGGTFHSFHERNK